MNTPSQQRPLYPSQPTIVLGLGALLLSWFGAFDSQSDREQGFAFGGDVKPTIVRLSDQRCVFDDWGIAIMPKGDYRFFQIEAFNGLPKEDLAFCSIDREVIGRLRPYDPSRDEWLSDEWPADHDSEKTIEDFAVTWTTARRDPGFASTVHVGRILGGTTPLILTVHQFEASSRRKPEHARMLNELLQCFEPL